MAKISFRMRFYPENGPEKFEDFKKDVLNSIAYANRMVYVDPTSAPKRIVSDMGNRTVIVESVPNAIVWQVMKCMAADRDIRAEIISVNMELDPS